MLTVGLGLLEEFLARLGDGFPCALAVVLPELLRSGGLPDRLPGLHRVPERLLLCIDGGRGLRLRLLQRLISITITNP